eukprot:3138659-Prymnesium_polylepis.3
MRQAHAWPPALRRSATFALLLGDDKTHTERVLVDSGPVHSKSGITGRRPAASASTAIRSPQFFRIPVCRSIIALSTVRECPGTWVMSTRCERGIAPEKPMIGPDGPEECFAVGPSGSAHATSLCSHRPRRRIPNLRRPEPEPMQQHTK